MHSPKLLNFFSPSHVKNRFFGEMFPKYALDGYIHYKSLKTNLSLFKILIVTHSDTPHYSTISHPSGKANMPGKYPGYSCFGFW